MDEQLPLFEIDEIVEITLFGQPWSYGKVVDRGLFGIKQYEVSKRSGLDLVEKPTWVYKIKVTESHTEEFNENFLRKVNNSVKFVME